MAKTPVPYPGYTTTKKLMSPIKDMLKELGMQDSCVQLQELSIEFLWNSALATKAPPGDFLKLLFKGHNIPHGTHDFEKLRVLVCTSYLVITYSSLEKMLNEVIADYKARHPHIVWQTKNAANENLAPLMQLFENLSPVDKTTLRSCPEFTLMEYYRKVRVASSHLKKSTTKQATEAFDAFSTTDLVHFEKCFPGLKAPSSPENINFDDFLVFTRAIKYYSRVINEICT